jgi:hypothetical protein
MVAAPLGPALGETGVEIPSAEPLTPGVVAERFMGSFSEKDMSTVRSLFASEAVVSRVRFGADGKAETAQLTAQDWADEAQSSIADVEDFRIEVLETSTVTFDQFATVSVRFRATGSAGPYSFLNNGIDTFAMTRTQGAWQIHQYSSFETLTFE